ncbi:MAG: hypothetical protein K8M05_27020 [Deltaproteobacteria bacterium]|nr:hypothetical protein [Kofleriaceae bacterium]
MNVADALEEVELAIAEDRLGDATRLLGAVAQRLVVDPPAPLELAHASWLAGAVALREGDERSFVALSRQAVEGLRLAGEDARMQSAIASRAELLEQLADLQEVQERGAAGLMDVLDRQCARLCEMAAIGAVIDELELDAVESVLLAAVAPLTRAGRPLRANQLARTCFGDSYAHDEALLRLRDDSRLARGRALVPTAKGELALAPELLARLYGAGVTRPP